MKPNMIAYFASTHWDREWYKTVDEFRYMLVPILDKISSVLKYQDDFMIFTLDGQSCMLDDYFVIREDKREEITKLIKDGKLIIGPWYTMPDEFLVSSESIIKNLQKGHEIAANYGVSPLKTGYVCDCFGHIANLPQILRGFGIDNALISRGTNDSELECFFLWASPDGSDVITFKSPEVCGYGSFYFEVLHEFSHDYEAHLDEITAKAIQYVERELTRTSLPYVILMDGMDHEGIHEFIPKILSRLSNHYNCPVVQENLSDFLHRIKEVTAKKDGELTSHGKDNVMHIKLIPHTLSSRYDLKKANDACQVLLEYYAMPCAAMNEMSNHEYVYDYIHYAYQLLLQNHAHDSICGCSIDAVHREMMTRFEKVYFTIDEYFFRYCNLEYNKGVLNDKNSSHQDGCFQVKIFNPLPFEYEGLLEFDIDFSPDFPTKELPYVKYEQRNAFLIYDEQGNETAYNIIKASRARLVKMFRGHKRFADTHRVSLLSLLKPMGFTTFYIKPSENPYRITNRLSTSPNSCENEWLRFEINPNGTIKITDKETLYSFHNLHSFIDCCEMGDGWYHIRPIHDHIISSLGCNASIEKVFDGYAACKFLVRYAFSLPNAKSSEFGFTKRSHDYSPYLIESEFTVSRTSKLITVHTTIENNVSDHRLLLHMPTNLRANEYYVNQCNLIIKRPVGMDHSHYNWKETDISEYSFENMVLITEEKYGLLFLSKGGLHEVSCPKDLDNSIDITLLRCFTKTTGTNGESDGQLQGTQVFDYAFMPISSESHCDMVRIKDQYISGYKEFTIPENDLLSGLSLCPDNNSFTFHSADCAYITCMPSKNKGIIIRAANYSDSESKVIIMFKQRIKSSCLCDFLENTIGEVQVQENQVMVLAQPYKMINIHVAF